MEVFWKHKTQFEGLVIMMGGFHLLMTMQAIIGSRFADADLRDVAVRSEIILKAQLIACLTASIITEPLDSTR